MNFTLSIVFSLFHWYWQSPIRRIIILSHELKYQSVASTERRTNFVRENYQSRIITDLEIPNLSANFILASFNYRLFIFSKNPLLLLDPLHPLMCNSWIYIIFHFLIEFLYTFIFWDPFLIKQLLIFIFYKIVSFLSQMLLRFYYSNL